jgi:Tfp pilus assembly protein PilO
MEWLTWFDRLGQAYPLPEEVIENLRVKVQRQQGRIAKLEQLAQQERSRAEMAEFLAQQERSRAEQERLARLQLIDRLKQMGIDSSLLDD